MLGMIIHVLGERSILIDFLLPVSAEFSDRQGAQNKSHKCTHIRNFESSATPVHQVPAARSCLCCPMGIE